MSDLLASAQALHFRQELAQARRLYRRHLAQVPGDGRGWLLLAALMVDEGSGEGEVELAKRALAIDGPNSEALTVIGDGLRRSNLLSAAATHVREALTMAPSHPLVLHRLSFLALQARDREAALRWIDRLLAVEKSAGSMRELADARRLLAAAETPARRTSARPRYLLIRPWACGFWGEVQHVLTQHVVAEATGRVPVVHWGPDFRYRTPEDENGWDTYFQPLPHGRVEDAEARDLTYFPPGWDASSLRTRRVNHLFGEGSRSNTQPIYGLVSEADVVISEGYVDFREALRWLPSGHVLLTMPRRLAHGLLMRRIARLQPRIAAWIDALEKEHFRRRPVLAVHVRTPSLDKVTESIEGNSVPIESYMAPMDRFLGDNENGAIFLLSDFEPAIRSLSDRYGPRLLSLQAHRLTDPAQREVGLDARYEGKALALEVLRDVFLAARADRFLGDGASGVSCSVCSIRDWPEGTVQLLRRNAFVDRG